MEEVGIDFELKIRKLAGISVMGRSGVGAGRSAQRPRGSSEYGVSLKDSTSRAAALSSGIDLTLTWKHVSVQHSL